MNGWPGNVHRIDDADDPRLEDYRDIRDRDLRGPAGRPGLFITETALPVERMLACPGVARSVLLTEAWAPRIVPQAPADVPVYLASREVLASIAGFVVHRGLLAVGHRPPDDRLVLDAAVPRRPGPLTLLLCDRIGGIDNIGLLFRNAAAFAVDAVVLSPRCHDPLYRKAVRVSIGHVLTVPWARSGDWPGDLDRLRDEWQVRLVGAHAGPGAVALDEAPRPERVAVVVGQEYTGLADETIARCDHLVRIPMAEGVDSLNASVAAGIVLHRMSRGRRG